MELRHLRYFCVLAEELHFSRAAARLSISQPPLSVAIRQLEESVGAQLFERSSREVRLTAAGVALRASAQRLLAMAEDAATQTRRVAEGSMGVLRIGFVGAMIYRGLPRALRTFQAEFPRVQVTLTERNSADQVRALLDDELELGFLHSRPVAANLHAKLLDSEPFACCLPQNHRLARRRRLTIEDLRGEPFILFARSVSPEYHDRVLSICDRAGFRPEIRHEARHWLAIVSLVSQELGIALVPESLKEANLAGATFCALSTPTTPSEIYAAWRRGPENRLIKAFLASFAS